MNINDMIQECLKQLKSKRSANTVRAYKDGMAVFLEYLEDQEPAPQHFIDFPSYVIQRYDNKRTAQSREAAVSYLRKWMTNKDLLPWTASHTAKYAFTKEDAFAESEYHKPKVVHKDIIEASLEAVKTMKVFYSIERTRNKALILLLASSGIRVSEVAALNVNDIYLNEESVPVVKVKKAKRNKSFEVPLDLPEAHTALQKYWDERNWTEDNPPVFGRHDKQSGKKHMRLNAGGIERVVARLSEEMGLPGVITPHKYRHYQGTEWYKEYGELAAQKRLHHESGATTKGYVDLGEEYIMGLAKKRLTRPDTQTSGPSE